MQKIRAYWRVVKFIGITLYRAYGVIILEKVMGPKRERRDRNKMKWASGCMKALNIRVEAIGNFPDKGVLYVANHRSYMDIAAMVSLAPVSHLSKAEIAKWPIIGAGAKAVDTLFVKRESRESRNEARIVITKMLLSGHPVCVHAEGTTSRAPELLPFRPGAFYACSEHKLPVIPVAIEYANPDDAWIGDDTFMPHFIRAFGKPSTHIYVSAGPELTGEDPVDLMNRSWEWVNAELIRLRQEKRIHCG